MAINTSNYETSEMWRMINASPLSTTHAIKIEEPVKPNYYLLKKESPKDIGDVVEHLPFWLANAVKYLYRVEEKDIPISNLEKAIECIKREIERRNGKVQDS